MPKCRCSKLLTRVQCVRGTLLEITLIKMLMNRLSSIQHHFSSSTLSAMTQAGKGVGVIFPRFPECLQGVPLAITWMRFGMWNSKISHYSLAALRTGTRALADGRLQTWGLANSFQASSWDLNTHIPRAAGICSTSSLALSVLPDTLIASTGSP